MDRARLQPVRVRDDVCSNRCHRVTEHLASFYIWPCSSRAWLWVTSFSSAAGPSTQDHEKIRTRHFSWSSAGPSAATGCHRACCRSPAFKVASHQGDVGSSRPAGPRPAARGRLECVMRQHRLVLSEARGPQAALAARLESGPRASSHGAKHTASRPEHVESAVLENTTGALVDHVLRRVLG